jgi:aspartate dehydrogenase
MPKLLKIGIVGCGAIGSSLAKTIVTDFSNSARLISLYDIDKERVHKLSDKLHNRKLAAGSLRDLIRKVDLVVEATKADKALNIAKCTLSLSKDIMIMSVGGVIGHYKELAVLAQKNNVRVFMPSGAICGLDGLKAAACGKINKVTLTTKKNPRSLLGAPYIIKKRIALDKIKKDTVIFEGNAILATKAFPQNINVAATLSIAGIGPKDTVVRIIASPHTKRNIHEIEIESASGRIFTRTENVLHPDNPKTSYLAVLSAVATLKQILASLEVGT